MVTSVTVHLACGPVAPFIQNLICYLFIALWTNVSPAARAVVKVQNAMGYSGGPPIFSTCQTPVLCMSMPELEYPMMIPPSVIPCGLIPPSHPLAESDPELAAWASRRPTVFIVLSSHFVQEPDHATATLCAINTLFAKRSDVQVLWRWRNIGNWELPSADELDDRLCIMSRTQADATNVLRVDRTAMRTSSAGCCSWPDDLSVVACMRRAEEATAIIGAYRGGEEGRVVATQCLWEAVAHNTMTRPPA
jgi:hypothetical protein